MKAFSKFSFKSGKVAELDRQFPSYLSAWEHGEPTELCDEDTHFLYFHRGGSLLFGELEYRMMAGMYASGGCWNSYEPGRLQGIFPDRRPCRARG